jgi:hypothetical protein
LSPNLSLKIAFPESKSTCQPSASDNQHNLAAPSSVNWERRRHLSAWARISDALRRFMGEPFEDAEQLGDVAKGSMDWVQRSPSGAALAPCRILLSKIFASLKFGHGTNSLLWCCARGRLSPAIIGRPLQGYGPSIPLPSTHLGP